MSKMINSRITDPLIEELKYTFEDCSSESMSGDESSQELTPYEYKMKMLEGSSDYAGTFGPHKEEEMLAWIHVSSLHSNQE